MARLLYVTYDGFLDPLGGSQILPYVTRFRGWSERVVALSFEKQELLSGEEFEKVDATLRRVGIRWKPLRFTRRGGVFGKVWDLLKMNFWCVVLALTHRVDIVHGRGHPASQAGALASFFARARLIFDLRGLWADERVDKGGWNLQLRSHRWQYQHYKRVEKRLLARADHVVVLTSAVVPEVTKIGSIPPSKVTVIPCCADFDHFDLTTTATRAASRDALRIPQHAMVLGYVGSVGRMYMLDAYLRLLRHACEARPEVYGLVVTRDMTGFRQVLAEELPQEWHHRVKIVSAGRNEVPGLLHAMDMSVSFILPSYARMAASPTKLAESFAAGVPVICNEGVGDVREQVEQVQGGRIVDPVSDDALRACARELDQIKALSGAGLRGRAARLLGLPVATQLYATVHARVLGHAAALDDKPFRVM